MPGDHNRPHRARTLCESGQPPACSARQAALRGARFDSIEGLTGSAFADTLSGDAGANRIDGRAGADVVAAGAGADTVRVPDGEGDRVSCGAGADAAISDRRTLDTLGADCETVDALPEPAGGGGQDPLPTGDDSDTALSFTLSAVRVQKVPRRRGIRMRLSCPEEPCTVTQPLPQC